MTVLAWTSPLAHIRVLEPEDFKNYGTEHDETVTVDRRDAKTRGQYEFPDDVAEVLLEKDPGWELVDDDDVVIELGDSDDVDDDDGDDADLPNPPQFP